MRRRFGAFAVVGAAGFAVQLLAVAALAWLAHWPAAAATAAAVEAAVLHNFFWHERWTWRDRGTDRSGRLQRLWRFHVANGVVSLAGNVAIATAAVSLLHLNPVVANVLAVGVMSAANFVVADRWVFASACLAACALLATPADANAAELKPETVAAWQDYAAAAERTFFAASRPAPTEPEGRAIPVQGGIIHEWRGSVFLRGTTVDRLVHALTHPGTPPPQSDVLESRVLANDGQRLRVFLKLERTAIVTVRYDTEHDVQFVRLGPGLATSRSASTKIAELGGSDHGFLWRLNSCWRYRDVPGGVQIDVLSLSLSRGMPAPLRPFASPIVSRVARESLTRTLDAMKTFGEGTAITHD
jgi:putative flippase GtrA